VAADEDRLKRAFRVAVASTDPLAAYGCLYRAKVVGQSDDCQRVDLLPVDDLLPEMAGVPLKTGVPGLTAKVAVGAYVLVGWEDRNPQRPFACLFGHPSGAREPDASDEIDSGPGEKTGHVESLTFASDRIQLGGPALATQPMVLGADAWSLEQELMQSLITAFTALANSSTTGPTAVLGPTFTNAAIDLQNYLTKKQAQNGCLSTLGFITK
jgi:hypothetical protein